MIRLQPDTMFPHDMMAEGGEELFVFDGSLKMGEDEEYVKWGWLRFPMGPPSDDRKILKSGNDGACIYRKTGHLTEKALSMEKIQIDSETESVVVRTK